MSNFLYGIAATLAVFGIAVSFVRGGAYLALALTTAAWAIAIIGYHKGKL